MLSSGKTVSAAAVLCLILPLLAGCSCGVQQAVKEEAVYLGVKDYGLEETNKDHKDEFLYRFEVNGEEKTYKLWNGTKDENCEAYGLAEWYMSEYYPEWYERYPVYLCDPEPFLPLKSKMPEDLPGKRNVQTKNWTILTGCREKRMKKFYGFCSMRSRLYERERSYLGRNKNRAHHSE